MAADGGRGSVVGHELPDYGFDGVITALLGATIVNAGRGRRGIDWLTGGFAALLASTVSLFVHTTRRGKFAVWRDILDDLAIADIWETRRLAGRH